MFSVKLIKNILRVLLVVVVYLVLLHPSVVCAQGNSLQKRIDGLLKSIVPIETTAEEVKKLLGEPITKSPDLHQFDEFNVLSSYTTGLYCKDPTYGWRVSRDRLITFVIIIKAEFHQKDLQKLGIDLSKFERKDEGHVPVTSYDNAGEGLGLIVNGDQVTSISLYPGKKYLHLLCGRTDKKARRD